MAINRGFKRVLVHGLNLLSHWGEERPKKLN